MNFVGVVERDDWLKILDGAGHAAEMPRRLRRLACRCTDADRGHPRPCLWALMRRPCRVVGGPRDAARATPATRRCRSWRRARSWRSRTATSFPERSRPTAWTLPRHFAPMNLARYGRTSRVVNGSADNTKRFHNPLLGDPAAAQAYVEREWAEDRLRERYDWMYRYDATAVAV